MVSSTTNTRTLFAATTLPSDLQDTCLKYVDDETLKVAIQIPDYSSDHGKIWNVFLSRRHLSIKDGWLIGPTIRNNKAVISAAIRHDPYELQYVDNTFKNDREVIFAAVQKNGLVLGYASD